VTKGAPPLYTTGVNLIWAASASKVPPTVCITAAPAEPISMGLSDFRASATSSSMWLAGKDG